MPEISWLFFFVSHLTFAQPEGLLSLSANLLLATDSLNQYKVPEQQRIEATDSSSNTFSVPKRALKSVKLFYNRNLVRLTDPVNFLNDRYSALNPNVKRFALPLALVGAGFVGLGSNHSLDYDAEIHEDILEDYADFNTSVDNHTLFIPLVAVYGLNIAGIKGEHNLVELSIIALTSEFITSTITNNLKTLTREIRPDGSSADAFPSGHTSSAFSKATILWVEYRNKNIWYGVGGYALASATGALRMLNKRHWLSDVLAGAGVGILSTQAVYAIYP